MHINPMLNEKARKPRKKRSDSKRDIKIPVTQDEKEFIIRASIGRGESETEYCTKLIQSALERNSEFDEVEYQHSSLSVHIKLSQEWYDIISYYAALWHCRSIRKVAHRIFMQSLRLERGEIIFEGI
ncbi:hypothetical protein [Bacillus sp. FJAT-45037]|uniref:hypothetical protein n=1 Tax=Bacillus sp. FJAT-45037 TaxID=2011007 RepID=UPI000C24009F|nr:hypothetical protein [Bacillus sp. FJAT-45037]